MNDAYTLDLPGDLPRDQAYALDVILYRIASKEEVGRTTIDGLRLDPHEWRSIEPPARNFTAPEMPHPLDAVFGDQIQLLGYDLKREGDIAEDRSGVESAAQHHRNYKVFAHVFDPRTRKGRRAVGRHAARQCLSHFTLDGQRGCHRDAHHPVDEMCRRETIASRWGCMNRRDALPVSGTMGVDAGNQRVILAEEIRP